MTRSMTQIGSDDDVPDSGTGRMATRNPGSNSPVEGGKGSLNLIYFKGVLHPRWLEMGFLNHQQYCRVLLFFGWQ